MHLADPMLPFWAQCIQFVFIWGFAAFCAFMLYIILTMKVEQ